MVVLAAGCLGSGDNDIAAARLPSLVLQPEDLPAGFTQFDEGRLARSDVAPGRRQDPRRFGRRGGWKARYRRPGSSETRGPLVVESIADLFESEDGAERDLAAYRADLRETGGAEPLPSPGVGDESLAITIRQGRSPFAVRFYVLAWRERNATASLLVQGFEGKLRVEDALELARKHAQRMADA